MTSTIFKWRIVPIVLLLLTAVVRAAAQKPEVALPMLAAAQVPLYPPVARVANVEGVVHVKVTTDGHRVTNAEVLDGHKLLAESAEKNVRTWEFATHEPTTFTVTYSYKLVTNLKAVQNNPRVVLQLPTRVEVDALRWPGTVDLPPDAKPLALGASARQSDTEGCPVTVANAGRTITVRGTVVQAPHDMLLSVAGCVDPLVVAYAGDEDTGVPASQLQRDKNLQHFRSYATATYKSRGKNICIQCPKYEVEATLTGRLDIATLPEGARKDPFGFARDANGKVLGKVGWGHPIPIYKCRLVVEAASNVVARKLPRPSPSNPPGNATGETPAHGSGHGENLQRRP
jgi:hypothetical protein